MAHVLMLLYLLLIPCAVFAEVYYVKPDIDSSCPEDPCHTISEYAAQPKGDFSYETRFILLQGEHYLTHNFSIHYIGELVFTGYDSVSLTCAQNIGFDIGNIENVTFTGLNIFGCTMSLDNITDAVSIEHSCIQNVSNSKPALYLSTVQESTIFNSSFAFIDVEVTDSIACSAVRAHNTNLSITNSTFDRNSAISRRLPVSSTICMFNSNVTLEKSGFIGNTGIRGGVLYAENSKIYSLSSVYSNNHATYNGVSGMGGVAYIQSATFFLNNCTFSDNEGGQGGGVLYLHNSFVTAVNCKFQKNSALYGGVASLFNASVITLEGCNFSSNRAEGHYGGVLNADGSITITINGCRFVNNSAFKSGGCIHMKKSCAYLDGVNVFESNRAEYGGAFTVDNSSISVNGGNETCDYVTEFTNNIAEHGGALNIHDYSTGNIWCSRFEANRANRRGGAILSRTNTNISLMNTKFYKNSAHNEGGAIFAQFAFIYFKGSLIVDDNECNSSGIVYASSCNISISGDGTFLNNRKSFLVHNSYLEFTGKSTFTGGVSNITEGITGLEEGGAITAVRSDIAFKGNVLLENNYGVNGGALQVSESVLTVTGQCAFRNNSAENGGALYAYKSDLVFKGETFFESNNATENGGGIYTVSSRLEYYSHSYFFENTALNGGAIYLDRISSLSIVKSVLECTYCYDWYCTNNTDKWLRLVFDGNHASEKGGAIYKNDTEATTCDSKPFENNTIYKECFIQTIAVYKSAYDWNECYFANFANINFTDNTAPDGALLFGGLLDRCAVDSFAEQLQFHGYIYPLTYLKNITSTKFTNSDISSDAVRVCFCTEDNDVDCSLSSYHVNVERGQAFSLRAAVVTQMNETVADNVSILASFNTESVRLGNGQSNKLVNETCSILFYNFFSAQSDKLYLYPEGPCGNRGISSLEVIVNISEGCPLGFALSNDNLECVCNPAIKQIINCSIDTESIVREGDYWISSTVIDDDDNTTNVSIIIHDHCPYDYCYPATERVEVDLNRENGSDAQCAFHRSGRLCGSCKDGYSLTLGSSTCEQCSNYWLLLVFPFGLAGIGLVVLMMVCNLTVTSGTINGLLFYANILIVNRTIFFSYQKQNVLTIFVSWLGLNLGVATCFYDGMDGFGKMWVQILFEVYLIALVVVILVLGRNTKVAAFFHNHNINPVHTLATLIMLSYEKLSRRTFSLLAFTQLKLPSGDTSVWLFDPSLDYMKGKFISLAVVASFVIIAGIVFNITLLFSKQIVAWSKYASLNNFIESFNAPFKPNHKYWAGLLLLVRNISYFICEFLNAGGNPEFNLHFIFVLLIGLLTLKLLYVWLSNFSLRSLQSHSSVPSAHPPLRDQGEHDDSDLYIERNNSGIVYKSSFLDQFETFFLINLSLLTYFTLYYNNENEKQSILFYISSSVVLVSFAGVVIYHTCVYTPMGRCIRRLYTSKRTIPVAEGYGSTAVLYTPTRSEVHIDSLCT